MERIEVMKGEKISLVVPEREDAKIWYQGINDVENQVFLGYFGRVFFLEDEYDFYEELRKKKDRSFSIMIRETGKILGNISLFAIEKKHRNASLGILIGDKTEQNKGYGTEVMQLMLKYAFEVMGLHKVKLDVFSVNERAIALYKKVGFREVGVFREDIYLKDRYIDKIAMEIFQKDFLAKNL